MKTTIDEKIIQSALLPSIDEIADFCLKLRVLLGLCHKSCLKFSQLFIKQPMPTFSAPDTVSVVSFECLR